MAVTMLARLLKGEGYRVVTAANGIEATQLAYSEAPDLIVLALAVLVGFLPASTLVLPVPRDCVALLATL